MKKKTQARVTREGKDYEREAEKRPLTEQQIKDNLPHVWQERAQTAKRQISVPIPGTEHST